jgi:hypothetical protein
VRTALDYQLSWCSQWQHWTAAAHLRGGMWGGWQQRRVVPDIHGNLTPLSSPNCYLQISPPSLLSLSPTHALLQAYKVLGQGTTISNNSTVQLGLAYLHGFELAAPPPPHPYPTLAAAAAAPPPPDAVAATAMAATAATPLDVAGFLRGTDLVLRQKIGQELLATPKACQRGFLATLLGGQDYTFVFLPAALRMLFSKVSIEGNMTSSQAVAPVFAAFLDRYVLLNPEHSPMRESLHLLCYALLLLSIDQFNPHVKIKMTKREFSRNNRSVLDTEHYDLAYLDRLYNNVCQLGPIAQPRKALSALDALAALT